MYIDKLETEIEQSIEAFLGDMVHKALEKLYRDLKFQKLLSLNELLDFYNEMWQKNWNENILIVREEYDKENYRMMGEKYITDYYNRYKPFNQSRTLLLESQRTVNIGENYYVHVRIDRLSLRDDNVYEIHDYKTSGNLPTQKEVDEDRQLGIYAYGVKKMYPDAKKIELVWHYLAFDKEMRSTRTDEQLETLRQEVLALIKKIESSKEFPAVTSSLCEWCEFQALCPKMKHKFMTEQLPPNRYLNEEGVKLVNEYAKYNEQKLRAERELERIKKALVGYAKKTGISVVYGSDVKATIKTYTNLGFPKKDSPERKMFIETLKKLGLWEQLAIPDVYELTKMINNGLLSNELIRCLDKFIRREDISKVYLGKK